MVLLWMVLYCMVHSNERRVRVRAVLRLFIGIEAPLILGRLDNILLQAVALDADVHPAIADV